MGQDELIETLCREWKTQCGLSDKHHDAGNIRCSSVCEISFGAWIEGYKDAVRAMGYFELSSDLFDLQQLWSYRANINLARSIKKHTQQGEKT